MRLRVANSFGVATLQDEGRPGYRRFGVPVGGAFDRESFRLANALLGNDLGAPAIEFALGTLELEALDDGCLAVVGAASSVTCDGQDKGANLSLSVKGGHRVTLHPPVAGLRTYIAVPGGVRAQLGLGSVSGQPVEAGGTIESHSSAEIAERHLADLPNSLTARPLRVVVQSEEQEWASAEYTVGRNIDRVGLRLEGPKPMVDASSGTSEPSVFGAVQLTEDRTLIVHGPDGPTIGGYIKLGGVVRADLDRLGQLAPGDRVTFLPVSLQEARAALHEEEERQAETLKKIALAVGGAA